MRNFLLIGAMLFATTASPNAYEKHKAFFLKLMDYSFVRPEGISPADYLKSRRAGDIVAEIDPQRFEKMVTFCLSMNPLDGENKLMPSDHDDFLGCVRQAIEDLGVEDDSPVRLFVFTVAFSSFMLAKITEELNHRFDIADPETVPEQIGQAFADHVQALVDGSTIEREEEEAPDESGSSSESEREAAAAEGEDFDVKPGKPSSQRVSPLAKAVQKTQTGNLLAAPRPRAAKARRPEAVPAGHRGKIKAVGKSKAQELGALVDRIFHRKSKVERKQLIRTVVHQATAQRMAARGGGAQEIDPAEVLKAAAGVIPPPAS